MAYAKAIDTAPFAAAVTDASGAVTPAGDPPISYVVAVWLGTSDEDIERGLREGWIAPPPGAPAGWQPPWATQTDSAAESPDPGGGGSVGTGTNVGRAKLGDWFHALDPTLTATAFDGIWAHSGADDSARADALFGYLQRTLLGRSDGANSRAQAAPATEESGAIAALNAYLADPSHRAQIVDLAGKSGAALAELAKSDIGYRYALANLDSIALTGNRAMFAGRDSIGGLDRYDPDTGELNLSDAWIGDRAKFLAWKMRADAGGDLSVPGTDRWVFSDRSLRDADGSPVKIEIGASDGAARTNQVIFGQDVSGGETIKGDAGTDRIYGGSGDDVIRGNAGDDHLEGGRGDDIVRGGNGNDEVIGGRGDDELIGGSGNDVLDGGSGDDTLTGGSGDDQLSGGDGNDTYVIDAGQGNDTIVDSDGNGNIEFDGEALDGALARGDGTYFSGDGRVVYSFSGDADSAGTLTIALHDGSPSNGDETPVSTLKVRNWKNGDLGIQLRQGAITNDTPTDPSDAPPETSSDAVSNTSSSNSGAMDAPALVDVALPSTPQSAAAQGGDSTMPLFPPMPTPDPDAWINGPSVGGPGEPTRQMALLTAYAAQQAVKQFKGVPEAPDTPTDAVAADHAFAALTPYDVSSAMLDFHDSGDLGHDVGIERAPMPAPTLGAELHTTGSSVINPSSVDKAAKGIGRIN